MADLKTWDMLPVDIPDAVSEVVEWHRVTGGRWEYRREVVVSSGGRTRQLRQLLARVTNSGGGWTAESRAKRRSGISDQAAAFGLAEKFAGVQLEYQRRNPHTVPPLDRRR